MNAREEEYLNQPHFKDHAPISCVVTADDRVHRHHMLSICMRKCCQAAFSVEAKYTCQDKDNQVRKLAEDLTTEAYEASLHAENSESHHKELHHEEPHE